MLSASRHVSMLLSSCDVPMVKWTWKRWALHPACHIPWNGGKSLGPADGRRRDQQRKWLNENQFNSSGRHQCSEECEKSVEEKEKGRTLQVPCERLWTGKVEKRTLYTTSLSIFVMPPKAKLNQQCSRYLQENTDYQDKVRFLFQAGLLSEPHFRRGKPSWNEGDGLWFPDFQAINHLSDSPSNWMHVVNQWYHVASNHCL